MNRMKFRLLLDFHVGGILHALLKPPTMALGWLLRRNHDVPAVTDVTIVKLLGGGSIVMAYPSLLALRQSGKIRRLRLLATPHTADFGEVLGLFDEIIIIRDDSLLHVLGGSLRAIARLWRTDAIVDLEIHSRLSTVLCLLTAARNRIGAYTEISFWRRSLATHLLFYNLNGPVYLFYHQIARLFSLEPPTFAACVAHFRSHVTDAAVALPEVHEQDMALAPLCSEFTRERMLREEDWEMILQQAVTHSPAPRVHLLGGPADRPELERLRVRLAAKMPQVQWINHAGQLSLRQSVCLIRRVQKLYCIDSSLLHLARLLGVPTVSYWGPTDPATRLAPSEAARHEVHYHRISCSPCAHIGYQPPCKGRNTCMRFAADPTCGLDENPIWLAQTHPCQNTTTS
jgi:ADP-heptose:LPS heptosyltransferase